MSREPCYPPPPPPLSISLVPIHSLTSTRVSTCVCDRRHPREEKPTQAGSFAIEGMEICASGTAMESLASGGWPVSGLTYNRKAECESNYRFLWRRGRATALAWLLACTVARPTRRWIAAPHQKYRERVSVGDRSRPIQQQQRSNRSRSVSAPRGNYPFRTFKRKPVANTNAARRRTHRRNDRTSKSRREVDDWEGNAREEETIGGLARRRASREGKKRERRGSRRWSLWPWSARELGKGLYALSSVRRGSHGFQPGIFGADRHADGRTDGRTDRRTNERTEREDATREGQAATARVSSDASPHLSVRI